MQSYRREIEVGLVCDKRFVLLFDHENRMEEKLANYVQTKINSQWPFMFVIINVSDLELEAICQPDCSNFKVKVTYEIMIENAEDIHYIMSDKFEEELKYYTTKFFQQKVSEIMNYYNLFEYFMKAITNIQNFWKLCQQGFKTEEDK